MFDGVDDYLRLTPGWSFGGEISIEVYINIAEMTVEPAIVSLVSDLNSDEISLHAGNGNGNIVVRRRPYGGNYLSSTNAANETNTWIHIVATIDSANGKIYKNGQLDTTVADSSALPATGTRSYYLIGKSIAADAGYSGRLFNGTVAYVRIWHGTVLDATQVSTLYDNRDSTVEPEPEPEPPPTPTPDHEFMFHGATALDGLADTYDSSITVTNNGATLSANGAVFDGTNDYLSLTPWGIGPVFSFEVYFKWDSFPSTDSPRIFDFYMIFLLMVVQLNEK